MVYNTRDFCVLGLCQLSGILKNTNEHYISGTECVSKMLSSVLLFRIPDDGRSPKIQ
jgi:hypothetical protein